jgi:hypothetical protein
MTEITWTELRSYGAQYEAVLAVAILEAAGIPTLVKGPGAGVFGPGMAGHSPIAVGGHVAAHAPEAPREQNGTDGGPEAPGA